jgi:hypothetical protein
MRKELDVLKRVPDEKSAKWEEMIVYHTVGIRNLKETREVLEQMLGARFFRPVLSYCTV